ncbi:carbohydrate ABC transporter permease [Streptomyces sp. NPDC002838]|uniref:carbohydrate ABC transporter permease n=1 Tax=Streptomyces sp. NPDC002838 TaxID=3154436 RepID=UPI0033330EB2
MTSVSPAPAPASARPGRRRRPSLRRIGLHAARIALALFFAFPIVFMLVSSFKPDEQIFGDLDGIKAFLPVGALSLDNYTGVFDRVPAIRFLLNSIGISVITVGLSIFINSLAAFALSRMRWRGKKIVLTAVIATLVVPFETYALPMVWWVNKLPWLQLDGGRLVVTEGWLDTYQVQILPFVGNALFIFLFHQYFQSIPKELDEAAVLDGASWFGIYRRIVMPLSGPAIATVAILAFLPMWNQYLWPLMVVQSEELRPVMVGIDYFFQLNPSWGEVMAYSSMITVPVLALFVAFQRAFVNSIASSGVKG